MADYLIDPRALGVRRGWQKRKPPLGTQVNWRHPLTQDLEACWLLNEGSGQVAYDATGHGHTVTYGQHPTDPPAPVWAAVSTPWFHGAGLQLMHGTPVLTTESNIDTPVSIPGNAFTIEVWLTVTAFQVLIGQSRSVILGMSVGENPESLYVATVGTGWQFAYRAQPSDTFALGPGALVFGQWAHLVLTREPVPPHLQPTPLVGRMSCTINGDIRGTFGTASFGAVEWSLLANGGGFDGGCDGALALARVWRRALRPEEILSLYTDPFAMFQRQGLWQSARIPTITPARMQWTAHVPRIDRFVRATPARLQWQTHAPQLFGTLQNPLPAQMQWRTNLFHRTLTVTPARMQWQRQRQQLSVGFSPRDCGPEYDAALQKTSIAGDWLVTAPAIGLFASFNYNEVGGYEHRVLDISDIEINVRPGGGIASIANVTVQIAETGSGQSLVKLWETAAATGAVTVTIDFLAQGTEQILRIYVGAIDSITVKDGVSQVLCVDNSIQKNRLLPPTLITTTEYPNADQAALTKVQPLVYGQGRKIGAVPLLLVDVTASVYLVAAHAMRLGGTLAVYDSPTESFLTLGTVVFGMNEGADAITLGALNLGGLRVTQDSTTGGQAGLAVDGNSLTTTVIQTNIAGPHSPRDVPINAGWGFAGWSPLTPGTPMAGTLQIDVYNHRRSPGSDPTVTGTFWIRTFLPDTAAHLRNLYVSPAFNHTTSAQHNRFIVSNVNISVNEWLQVLLIAQCQGQIGGVNQTYEVGEVSVTPLAAFSAIVSGTPTAVGLPINVQELRFNVQRPNRVVLSSLGVINSAYAIDGNSTTIAQVRTQTVDSNFDGYGELVIATSVTSAFRANNTVIIDLINHRRGLASTPTVTGTFAVQTHNVSTGQLRRTNLFATESFRHQLNPLTTSYVITGVNLGTEAQLAVRLVARNEGGAGGAGQLYEVGEIGVETCYQPQGDSGTVFLLGEGYEGRRDTTGDVTAYIGRSPERLFQTPDQVIASLLVQEMGLGVDDTAFAAASNWYTIYGVRIDGGIGAGWAVEQLHARDLLEALAQQSTAVLFPTFENTWALQPFRTDIPPHNTFGGADILTEYGNETQRPEERTSTLQLTMGNLQDVHNHIEVRYKYNTGSRKYDGVYSVTHEGSNLPADALDKAEIEETCLSSWLRYGDMEPLIIEAYWLADETTAAYLLRHLALYFSQQRLTAQFETTLKAACLQVGDMIALTDNSLPEGNNGGTFEVHTVRYQPMRGRVQLVASAVASIPDVTRPAAPLPLTGCARLFPSDGQIACWDFEEASGDRVDHLYGYTLTAINNPVGVPGKVGQGVQFLRASNQALVGTNVLPGALTGDFTLACWVRLLSAPVEDWVFCANADDINTGAIEFLVGVAGFTQRVWFVVGNTLVYSTDTLPFTNTPADWTLLTLTCRKVFLGVDGTQVFLTVQINNNAAESFLGGQGGPAVAYQGFTVGAGYAGGGNLTFHSDAVLDQLMLWRRVISTAEHDVLWNAGVG